MTPLHFCFNFPQNLKGQKNTGWFKTSWWMAQTPIRIENICLTLQYFPDQPNVWLAKVTHCYVISQMSLSYALSVIRTYNIVKILCFFVSCNKKSHLLLCHRIYFTWCFSTVLHPSYFYLCWRVRVKNWQNRLTLRLRYVIILCKSKLSVL